MAGRHGIASIEDLATGTAIRTMIQLIAHANCAIRITEISIGFTGTTNTGVPIKVRLLRQTTGGTMDALTPVKADDSVADALATTAQKGKESGGAEPTAGDVLRSWAVHPQTSQILPISDVAPLIVGVGDRVGLEVLAAADVDCDAAIQFEE